MDGRTWATACVRGLARGRRGALLFVAIMTVGDDRGGSPMPTRPTYEPRSFLGYDCGADCRRHKTGFAWALRLGLTDPRACPRAGAGTEFREACTAGSGSDAR